MADVATLLDAEQGEILPQGNLLRGKKGLIMGLANDKSLAWGIAKSCYAQGAELAFTFQGEIMEKRVVPLAKELHSNIVISCDVTKESEVENLFNELKHHWKGLDFIVHAIAFSDKNELKGGYVDTSLNNFLQTMHISCYSFLSVVKKAQDMLNDGASILTLTYYGAEKVVPHYNVMGVAKAALENSVKYLACDLGKDNIRVNAISAGPIRTLAASGISDFRYILKWNEYNSPLRRNVTIWDVGKSAVYLLSDLASGVTGETLHVDCGYNIIGMKNPEAPDISVA